MGILPMDNKRFARERKLVHAQAMVPAWVKKELAAYSRELDPEAPKLTVALRRVAVEWAKKRKAS